jgi:hypothetical protein
MELMKLLTLTQQKEKRDEMKYFRLMNSNYTREKISLSIIQKITKHNFFNL